MVKKREGFRFVILDPAKTWISEGKCGGCGKPKDDWKRSTRWKCCSVKCTTHMQEHFQYFGWPELRMKAFERDNFTCALCRQQPIIMVNNYEELSDGSIKHTKEREETPTPEQYAEKLVGDHIIPIACGGAEWDINNVQTLCIDCNKHKTKIDAGKIARLRFKESLTNVGQKFLGGDDG